jgi:protein JSN1
MAAVITIHSVRLATNANGALLLTWLLDTCNFPNRFKTLAPRLVTNLVKLCTHKLASLTVLKLINQRPEQEARDVVLNALFTSDDENKNLRRILEDQVHGAAVIYKILTSPFVTEQGASERRAQYVSVVRNMLQKLKVQPSQGYKRLMDEVGIADRVVATPPISGPRVPQRSTTPRDYTAPNSFAPGTFYSPQQHSYTSTPQYTSIHQLDALLGMEMQGSPAIYSPQQVSQTHTHQDSAQAAAYQYQQMLMMQRTYNGFTSSPQPTHQPIYQQSPSTQHSQFGGPLVAAQNIPQGMGNIPQGMGSIPQGMGNIPQGMGVYGVNGTPGYPYSQGDVYSRQRHR